jgi:hypothetical protein
VPRFYLHIHHGGFIAEDEEGKEFRDLEAARLDAVNGSREVLGADVAKGSLDLAGCVVITDEANQVVLTVPFRDVLQISGLD